jgi:DNA mismatch endonuclease (patch repair protein)
MIIDRLILLDGYWPSKGWPQFPGVAGTERRTDIRMADIFTKEKRSEVMSRIRGHGNRNTELALLKLFRVHRIFGWRRRQPVFGRPDFVFLTVRMAVFVDGCFWHGCRRHRNPPGSNRAFWRRKLASNMARDRRVNRVLRNKGWCIVRIWEHDLARRPRWCVSTIRHKLDVLRNKKAAEGSP